MVKNRGNLKFWYATRLNRIFLLELPIIPQEELLDVLIQKFRLVLKMLIYTEKLSPHPQVLDAFGLTNWKPLPFNPSVNSRTVPAR